MVMDVYQDYVLVTYRPFDVHIFHVNLLGELTPTSTPDLQVKECFFISYSHRIIRDNTSSYTLEASVCNLNGFVLMKLYSSYIFK